MIVTVAVEGVPDQAVAARLLREVGLDPGPIHITLGKARMDRQLSGYNQAAHFGAWFVLRDLNSDEDCATALRNRLLPQPSSGMCFRIAVREVEAWLLADQEGFAAFFSVSRTLLPLDADALADPKQFLLSVISRCRKRDIRADMLPRPGSRAEVGPAYNSRVAEFASERWNPVTARDRSDSLRRCIKALECHFLRRPSRR